MPLTPRFNPLENADQKVNLQYIRQIRYHCIYIPRDVPWGKLAGFLFGTANHTVVAEILSFGRSWGWTGVIMALEKQAFAFQNFDKFLVNTLPAAESSESVFPKPLFSRKDTQMCLGWGKIWKGYQVPGHSEWRALKFIIVIIFTIPFSNH